MILNMRYRSYSMSVLVLNVVLVIQSNLSPRRGSTPVSTFLRKSVRFFKLNRYIFINSYNIIPDEISKMVWTFSFPICKASSEEKRTSQYPAWMTQKPRKGHFRESNSKNFPGGACTRTPLKARAFGAHCFRNRSPFILDPRQSPLMNARPPPPQSASLFTSGLFRSGDYTTKQQRRNAALGESAELSECRH